MNDNALKNLRNEIMDIGIQIVSTTLKLKYCDYNDNTKFKLEQNLSELDTAFNFHMENLQKNNCEYYKGIINDINELYKLLHRI